MLSNDHVHTVACDNCGWTGPETDCLEIKDFHSRVEPGECVPFGECPECGALCHLHTAA